MMSYQAMLLTLPTLDRVVEHYTQHSGDNPGDTEESPTGIVTESEDTFISTEGDQVIRTEDQPQSK